MKGFLGIRSSSCYFAQKVDQNAAFNPKKIFKNCKFENNLAFWWKKFTVNFSNI